jgi:hypothetical protein
VTAKFVLNKNSSLKASFQRTRQFLHLLNNTVALSPFAIWKNSNTQIEPQKSDQYTIGYFRNFNENVIETSFELYYRNNQDVIDFVDASDLIVNPTIETEILQLQGYSYGMEFFLKKRKGRFQGWLSYTFSRTFLRTTSIFEEESINSGEYFPSNFDKPHILNLTGRYELGKRWRLSGVFTYTSGRPIPFPDARFEIDGVTITNISERNAFRIRDYHRLDLSLTFYPTLKKDPILKTSWTVAVYNLYGRKNPFTVFFGQRDFRDTTLTPFELAVIGRPIPSLTLNVEWSK